MDLSAILLIILLSSVVGNLTESGYDSDNNPYTEVPHSAISEEETSINLGYNEISNISDYEFEKYVNLTSLTLRNNPLITIPDNAFAGTKISYLDLSFTKLTNFPNLTVIAHTLAWLLLDGNPITEVPDELLAPLQHIWILQLFFLQLKWLPDISRIEHLNFLYLAHSVARKTLDKVPYSYCLVPLLSFSYPSFENYSTTELPEFQCDNTSKIHELHLSGFRLTETSDLTSLETLPKLHVLHFSGNHFTKFPKFTKATKKNLQHLVLSDCDIVEITEIDLEDFTTLKKLEIVNNPLRSIPGTIFQIVKYLLAMDFSPVATWDRQKWRNFLCMNVTLKELKFSGTDKYELVLPDLRSVFCHHSLKVTFEKVSPKDCHRTLYAMERDNHVKFILHLMNS